MATSTTTWLIGRHDGQPERVEFGPGELCAFSRRSPEKEVNEDAALALAGSGGALLAVADGMGGQNAGDRASRLAVEMLAEHVLPGVTEAPGEGPSLRHRVLDAFEAANDAVIGLGVGAGTTLAAVVLSGARAGAVHVGDSMVLHVGQRGRIKALTVSHSPTGYAVEAGLMDHAEALHHEDRHLVSNFVGLSGMRTEVGASIELAPRDTLVVASDGLSDNLSLDEIVSIVRKGPLDVAANALAQRARARMEEAHQGEPSKPDDLTFLLFRLGSR